MDTGDIQILSGVASAFLLVFASTKIRWVTPQKDKWLVILILFLAILLGTVALSY